MGFYHGIANPAGVDQEGYQGFFYTKEDLQKSDRFANIPLRIEHGECDVGRVNSSWVGTDQKVPHVSRQKGNWSTPDKVGVPLTLTFFCGG